MIIKYLKLMFLILAFLIFPTFINADVCSDAKKDAANVKASYKLIYKEGYPTFKITLSNMTKNIAAVDLNGSDNRSGVMYSDAILESYTIEIPIYDYNYNCDTPARIIEIKLPQYNQYADMDICSDIKDYKYCQKIITEDMEVSEIYDKLVAYKTALQGKKNDVTQEEIEEQFLINEDAEIYNINKSKEEVKQEKENIKDEQNAKDTKNKQDLNTNKVTIVLLVIVLFLLTAGIIIFINYKRKTKNMVVS